MFDRRQFFGLSGKANTASAGMREMSEALLGSGFSDRYDKVAAMQPPSSAWTLDGLLNKQNTQSSAKLLLPPRYGEQDRPPVPSRADRLDLDWNKRRVAEFRRRLEELKVDSFLVRKDANIVYLTGFWHTTPGGVSPVAPDRPCAAYMGKGDADPWFYYPAIDQDIIKGWWYGGGKMYFDVEQAAGAIPTLGTVTQGPRVNLFEDLLETLKAKGITGRVGVDGEMYAAELAIAKKVLPNVEFVNVGGILTHMREVKTPEELALWARAYSYFDRAHVFARDYLLTHGTDIMDFELSRATSTWLWNTLYADLDLRDGAPNFGVGVGGEMIARVGRVSAYPHPNQPYYKQIGPNMALQISGVVKIGGCGGENYRMYIIADKAGNFDPHMQRLWEVSQECCDIQMTEQVAGKTCSDVAYKIHKHQVENGMQKYIYHRPGHGLGWEGHESPYVALGDYTKLEPGMCFSEEPGLFDPETGAGFNWSDTVVTGIKTGYRMSMVPYTKEWSWVRL